MYLRLLGMHLRGALEYESDFWIMIFAAVLTQAVNFLFLKVVFRLIPALHGWTFWPIVIMFGAVSFGEGICSLFFEGMWRLAYRINEGELDYMLVRPYPVILQVTSAEIGLNGLGNITSGGVMLALGLWRADIPWSVGTALAAILLFASGITVKVAVSLATNAASFWIPGPNPLFALAVHQGGELTRYPLTLFPAALKLLLTAVVPFAFVGFFPVSYLTSGRAWWICLATPAVAAYCLLIANFAFRRGMLRYESTGN
jgi:ABC-2 type transport system permease protein